MTASSYSPGQRVELNDGRIATVRFVGTTSFQTGDWVGVELAEATGKNDGSVKGERYFQCEPNHGMFLRPAGVRQVLEDVKPKASKPVGNGVPGKNRASIVPGINGVKRQSTIGAAGRRGDSISESPTPAARPGIRSPTKQIGSNGVSSASTSRTTTPPVTKKSSTSSSAARPRQSLQPPSTTAGRKSTAAPTSSALATQRGSRTSLGPSSTASRAPAIRNGLGAPSARGPLVDPRTKQRLSSTNEETTSEEGSEQTDLLSPKESDQSSRASQSEVNTEHDDEDDKDDTIRPNFAPPAPPVPPDASQTSPTLTRSRRPSSPAAASIHSQRTIRSTAVSSRQIEELEAKVRLLERKRMEDRDVKKTLEQAKQDRDQYKGIIEKLQTKYRPQQQEITELKQSLNEAQKKLAELETTQAEHDSVVEMATLDREMAEETAEGLKAELEALRAHNEEVQLELDILKEENGELTKEMNPEERESAGWVQLQHSNDRLRNALLALRDRSVDEREELNQQIQLLEEEVKDLYTLRTTHEDTREKLLRSEADTEDLRQQLEVALQAEEMIEQLTERNGHLGTTVDEMRDAIEDLENLKELNDELEANHTEAEKQMQDEIDFKDALLLDRERTAKLQQEALDSKDDTIRQFRTLVSNLQADMSDMKASKQLTETEAKDLEDKSRAMLDLNLKLQNSAAKTQVKAIDLELRRLDAQEASEHLDIVQLFLPEAFHAERDSVLALLRFKRIEFKAGLVHGFIKERVSSFGIRGEDEAVFAACDVMDKLTWVEAMAVRFTNAVYSCSADDFARFGSALHELEPVERALNGYIDALRRDEVREREMAEELQRSIAVMSHLASLHIKDDLASHTDDLLMRTMMLQSRLETAAMALQLSRNMIEKHVSQSADEDEEDDEGTASDLALILGRADTLMNHARSAKVSMGKTHRALSDLQARSLTLETRCKDDFDVAEAIAVGVTNYTCQAGDALQTRFNDDGSIEAYTPSQVAGVLSEIAVAVFSLEAPEAGPLNALARRINDLTESLADLAALPNDLDNTVEFERGSAPWVARANELKQTKITSIDTEAELSRTVEALRGKDGIIKDKDTELEEQSVRIEMLEARMKDASKRSARIGELEKALYEAKDAERKAKQDMQRAREEQVREVERAREEMGRLGEEQRKGGASGSLENGAMGAGAQMTMKRQESKILALEGAVRFLKEENHRLRLPPPDSPLAAQTTLSWLHEPLLPPKTSRQARQETLYKEGKDLLHHLRSLAAVASTTDLARMPENRLAWRPVKESSRWMVEKRKEEWETWKDWRRDLVGGGSRTAAAAAV